MTTGIDCLLSAFRDIDKPHEVRGCDCPFCISTDGILRLLDADQRTLICEDLIPYVANVLGTVGGPQDFAYLLPAILKVWAEELSGYDSAFNQRLHPALLKDDFLWGYLSPPQREAVVAFMRESLLDRIGRETSLTILPWGSPECPSPDCLEGIVSRSAELERLARLAVESPECYLEAMKELMPRQMESLRRAEAEAAKSEAEYGPAPATYGWFRHFASFGVVAKDVRNLWPRWWSLPNEGCAVAALQYASCLICDARHNPVFPAPVGGMGGGAPNLWSYESLATDECWQAENVEFLASTLSVPYLTGNLTQALGKLSTPERRSQAGTVLGILEQETNRAEQRIPRLMELLGAPQDVLTDW